MANQKGILKQVKDDFVLIDAKWFRVLEAKYIPKGEDVPVEFETQKEDAGVIKFIKRAQPAGASSSSGTKSTYTKSNGGGRGDTTAKSIVRQVMFKGAVELVSSGKYPDIATAMTAIKAVPELETFLLGS